MSDTYLPGDTQQRIQDLIKDRKITQSGFPTWRNGYSGPEEL